MAGVEPARISPRLFENRMAAITSHTRKLWTVVGLNTYNMFQGWSSYFMRPYEDMV